MATMENKENLAPNTSSDPLQHKSSSPVKLARKGRSKSIGPGDLSSLESSKPEAKKEDAKNRRKSTYIPTTKSIISADTEKAERQAARRKTLANRRVSFAPEATLHTWDVVEYMRDQTTSTDSSGENTRRTSKGDTPYRVDSALGSDVPDHESEVDASPAKEKKRRRSSTLPQFGLPGSDDVEDESGVTGSSEVEESGDEDASGSDDDTGTAMSLDVDDNNTLQSLAESDASSTGSSARLEAALKQAAQTAGTRGIEYDENYEDDASMELAGDEVTNAFKPWVEQRAANQPLGSASLDQENVNPFSPAFKAQLVSGTVNRSATIEEEDTADMSMDMTRAVGGIVKQPAPPSPSDQLQDETMDLTQAVGKIQQTAQTSSPGLRSGTKRRRSTTEAGSPGAAMAEKQSKRRRSSAARSSMGDDTMDLTMAVGGAQNKVSPAKSERRKSKRRSSGAVSDQDEATMDFTQAVGSIKPSTNSNRADATASSLDSNEELTMELTTVLGNIKATEKAIINDSPSTPKHQSPIKDAQNTTPKDQDRFIDAPDSGPKKLLTPMFQKQVMHSSEKRISSTKKREAMSPETIKSVLLFEGPDDDEDEAQATPRESAAQEPMIPSLGDHKSPLRATPNQVLSATKRTGATPDSTLRMQLDAQLQASPSVQKQMRSSPVKIPSTPMKADEPTQDGRRLAASIKLLSTPRKETLKSLTPRKQVQVAGPSSQPVVSSRQRPTPKAATKVNSSPAKQLNEDLERIQSSDKPTETIQLQKFLDLANIRFMDLTTTKRRMTHATTPSKAKKNNESTQQDLGIADEPEVTLQSAILASATTIPQLDLYTHACHELKRYISDGKAVIKDLETETSKTAPPPLMQAYLAAGPKRKAALDAQMRDIKTQARGRSKEMWYSWRMSLLEDLMRTLSGVGEGLIKDDETLSRREDILEMVLPELLDREAELRNEVERLEGQKVVVDESEREELDAARERLEEVESEVEEKRRVLESLQKEMAEQESKVEELEDSKEEFTAAIKEAERVKEVCRGVSLNEITLLQESITSLEAEHNWRILSASPTTQQAPASITMLYKSHLQLFFHPSAFQQHNRKNAPISLTYTANQAPSTTPRFFLQLLRASLQALPQATTRVAELLSFVSGTWDTALTLAETERKLNLEHHTTATILSDEQLNISTDILLTAVRTKVRVSFAVSAALNEDEGAMEVGTSVEPKVEVVYGEAYDEKKMSEFVSKGVSGDLEGWEGVVKELREKLVARGGKGVRK